MHTHPDPWGRDLVKWAVTGITPAHDACRGTVADQLPGQDYPLWLFGNTSAQRAATMRNLLVAAGVDETAITLEDQSTTTLENIRFGARLAGKTIITIVTDRYHARRAQMVADHFGLDARVSNPAPTLLYIKQNIRDKRRFGRLYHQAGKHAEGL